MEREWEGMTDDALTATIDAYKVRGYTHSHDAHYRRGDDPATASWVAIWRDENGMVWSEEY